MGLLAKVFRSSAVQPACEMEEEEPEEELGELVLPGEDREMVTNLTERLVRSIRVEQSVVSM